MKSHDVTGIILAAIIAGVGSAVAEETPPVSSASSANELAQIIVQIGGRFCEYLLHDVEAALRRFQSVRHVKFLNDHGTVLVQYDAEGVPPVQLAASVEAAVSAGIGCRAWVDRGGPRTEGS
ncbi:MAG: hypothetical protein QM706_13625 [Nitrospira sp.]